MASSQNFNLQGLNGYLNPLSGDESFLRAVNVDSYPYGGIKKRPGYVTLGGTTNGSAVQNLFQWVNDDGSQSYLYAKKGNVLQYYDVTAGTGDWVTCGNGTFAGTANIGHTVLENTLIVGDDVGSTRHTTNGTSFTNTVLAPIAGDFEQFQRRVYAIHGITAFYSTTNDPTNWETAGTSDSNSFQVPGEGNLIKITKNSDRILFHKANGNMFRWDGDTLVDMATNFAMTSRQSYAEIEDVGMWLNRQGFYISSGDKPELISNPIQPWIYNDYGTGIAGTVFNNAPGATHRFDYYLSVGDIADDITHETIPNAVIKYNYQKNLYYIYSFANRPTALTMYEDNQGTEHMIFGDSKGQVYVYGGTATSDNGVPIESVCEMIVSGGDAGDWKKWQEYSSFFNPGSKAKLQMGICDTFRREGIKLTDLGDTSQGAVRYRFPQGSRSKLLYVKVYENSGGPRWIWYGHAINFEVDDPRDRR